MKIADNPYYYGLTTDGRAKLANSEKALSGNSYYEGLVNDGDVRLKNTAEAISEFIITVGVHHNLEIWTSDGDTVFNTIGIWIDKCPDKEFLAELKKVLNPKLKELVKTWGSPELP